MKWQYFVVYLRWDEAESTLNQLGTEGWELVTVRWCGEGADGTPAQDTYILKRPQR